jgi:hypothetical protein
MRALGVFVDDEGAVKASRVNFSHCATISSLISSSISSHCCRNPRRSVRSVIIRSTISLACCPRVITQCPPSGASGSGKRGHEDDDCAASQVRKSDGFWLPSRPVPPTVKNPDSPAMVRDREGAMVTAFGCERLKII